MAVMEKRERLVGMVEDLQIEWEDGWRGKELADLFVVDT